MGHVLFLRKGWVHTAPVTGVKAGTLAVGSTVKLMEGGTAVEYLVVNQGIPSNSSLYDASCDGTWLLRKDIHSKRVWDSSNVNKYESRAINTWLNGDFFNTLGATEQAAVKQARIPYRSGGDDGTNQSGTNGLPTKIFLLSGYEGGWTASDNDWLPVDGAKLAYFESGTGTPANNKRIANYGGEAADWWLRSPALSFTNRVFRVYSSGSLYSVGGASSSRGIRPALILPKTALFDKDTLLLKGAA